MRYILVETRCLSSLTTSSIMLGNSKLVVVLCGLVVCFVTQSPAEQLPEQSKSSFSYAVTDPKTGDFKSHKESRDGNHVHGQYKISEADGSTRTVEYNTDDHGGFSAVVNTGTDTFTSSFTTPHRGGHSHVKQSHDLGHDAHVHTDVTHGHVSSHSDVTHGHVSSHSDVTHGHVSSHSDVTHGHVSSHSDVTHDHVPNHSDVIYGQSGIKHSHTHHHHVPSGHSHTKQSQITGHHNKHVIHNDVKHSHHKKHHGHHYSGHVHHHIGHTKATSSVGHKHTSSGHHHHHHNHHNHPKTAVKHLGNKHYIKISDMMPVVVKTSMKVGAHKMRRGKTMFKAPVRGSTQIVYGRGFAKSHGLL